MEADRSHAEASDGQLIGRWLAGDERAATLLVERHAEALARYAVTRGAEAEAAELVQDTFVRAFASLDDFRAESTLRTWLFTILRRLFLDRRRSDRRRRRQDHLPLEAGEPATSFDALDGLVAVETAERIRGAVDRLSPNQREVFLLRVTEGLSYREIAELVGTTEGAARVHYHNALRTVKEWLDE